MNKRVKYLLIAAAVIICGAASARATDWQQWHLVQNNIAPGGAAWDELPKAVAGKSIVIPVAGVDLNKLLSRLPAADQRLWLVKKVTVAQDKKIKLGMGVDCWFEVYCNRKIVYSSCRSSGNATNIITSQDHIFELELQKGENFIAICLESGKKSFQTALQVMPPDAPAGRVSRMRENEIYNPSRFQLRQGPWLLEPAPGRMTVAFLTDGNVAGGVEYRLAGSRDWTQLWDTIGGILNNATDLHRITLTGLEPGKVYEYRVLIALNSKDYKALDIHRFRVPPAAETEFEFFATGDTQFSAVQRGRYLAGWHDLMKNAAFHISLGDLADTYDDFDQMVFGGYFNWLAPAIRYNKPFIAVHGNHELRGQQSARWMGLFGSSKNRGYYSFNYGKVCFVVLDCWGDTKDMQFNSLSRYAAEKYLQEQYEWVKKLVDSPEYISADYRIIMSHSAPHACGTASGIGAFTRKLSEPLVKASRESGRQIHLFLAGHIHRYRRSVPGEKAAFCNASVRFNELRDGKQFNFPIVIIDGPGKNIGLEVSSITVKVGSNCIEVKSFDEKSRCFDHFTVDKKGKVCEKENSYKKSQLKKYAF